MAKKKKGWVLLISWGVLIISGIVTKRVYDHPDWMVFFHGPAAVCLVLSFRILSKDFRARYQLELSKTRVASRPGRTAR